MNNYGGDFNPPPSLGAVTSRVAGAPLLTMAAFRFVNRWHSISTKPSSRSPNSITFSTSAPWIPLLPPLTMPIRRKEILGGRPGVALGTLKLGDPDGDPGGIEWMTDS